MVARKDGETTGADEDAYHEKLREERVQERAAAVQKRAAAVQPGPVKKKPKVVKF